MSFCSGCLLKSSTDPSDDNEVDEADAVGESSGDPARELFVVEGIESTVMCLLRAAWCGRAVVAIEQELGDTREEVLSLDCLRDSLLKL